eukprot:2046982-Rhodomonas_salina.2
MVLIYPKSVVPEHRHCVLLYSSGLPNSQLVLIYPNSVVLNMGHSRLSVGSIGHGTAGTSIMELRWEIGLSTRRGVVGA